MKILNFDVTDLYMLVLLDQGLSITHAAKKLHLTQPAVSQRLSRLRNVLEVALHTPGSGKTVKLTPEGKKLADASLLALKILELAMPEVAMSTYTGDISDAGKPIH